MQSDVANLVIDNGSGLMKCGFGGDSEPRAVFHNVVGRPKNGSDGVFVGNDALSIRNALTFSCPIENGIITNWGDMIEVWKHIFEKKLKVSPAEHPIMLTESPLNTRANREMTAQIMFEMFNAPAIYLADSGTLSPYISDRVTGVVLDLGSGLGHAIPIYEGTVLLDAVTRLDLAGTDLTDYLLVLLAEKGLDFTQSGDGGLAFGQEIKDRFCYVAPNLGDEMDKDPSSYEVSYAMPDGQRITIGNERFRCPEALFQPSLIGKECAAIHESVHNCIMKCDESIRFALWQNVVLSGGTTMLPNIETRLREGLSVLAPPTASIRVITPAERKYGAWVGGAILSEKTTFQPRWISKQKYDVEGPSIVHKHYG